MSRPRLSTRFLLGVLFAVSNCDCYGQEQPARTDPIEPRAKVQDLNWRQRFIADEGSESEFARPLVLPGNSTDKPAAGKRVAVTPDEYVGTQVHHMLFLPKNWDDRWKQNQKRYPVIVELTGNYFPKAGSTGKVEHAGLGFGISKGQFIWVTMPFISADHQSNAVTWWGDEAATVNYLKQNLPRVCETFGGDPESVILCGFSRGAIGVNLIGLHDDEISNLWCGFITHDHFDGVKEWRGTDWGSPLVEYRAAAALRLGRLRGRPVLVCQNGDTRETIEFLKPIVSLKSFTFLNVDTEHILGRFPNELAIHPHTDRWLLKDSPERRAVWNWVGNELQR